jgi:hypothetical protein
LLEKIKYKKKLMAIIVRKSFSKKKGISFVTPNEFNIQFAFMNHQKDYNIRPHLHFKKKLKKINTSEVIYLVEGKLRIDFYSKQKKYLFSKVANKGDTVMLIDQGHGFKTLKKTIMLEVKQGPYSEKIDKVKFDSVDERKIKIKK